MQIKKVKLIKKNDKEIIIQSQEDLPLDTGNEFYIVCHGDECYQIFNKKQFDSVQGKINRQAQEEKKKFAPFWQNGYAILKPELTKVFCNTFFKEIKAGEIRGMKDFDGQFYILDNSVFTKKSGEILDIIKNGEINLKDIAEKTKMKKELVKTICLFLKEDGEILEKKKDFYKII